MSAFDITKVVCPVCGKIMKLDSIQGGKKTVVCEDRFHEVKTTVKMLKGR